MSLANATNPFAPNDEDMATLWLDRTNFLGAVLGAAAWGLHSVIVWLAIRGLMRSKGLGDPRTCVTIAFVFILFVMGTINFVGETGISLEMFVNNRMYPGGPTVYLVDHYDDPINQMGNSGYIIANFFTDGLMLWRAFVVWNKNYFVVILPFLLYLASTTMSVFVMYQISQPTASLWTTSSVNFTLSYFSMSITLNVLLTLLIAGRLISMSQRVKQTLGAHHAKTYTSIASMMIESAVPYSALGLAFIATFATNNPAQNTILPILSQVMCISPELIVWRVATGRSWSKETTGVTYGAPILGQTGTGSSAVQLSRLRFGTTQDSDRTHIGTMSKVSVTKDEIDSQV